MKRAESISDEEDTFDAAHITGNASDEIKQTAGNLKRIFTDHRHPKASSPIFGDSIMRCLKVTEISINKQQEEGRKLEARVVLEIDVTEGEWKFNSLGYLNSSLITDLDMLNRAGSVHGGCSAFLVDV
jgi:acyl-coenzyme A thioesterase 13